MSDELVHYSVASGIATITLDSPRYRNALSAQLRRELHACLAKARHDGKPVRETMQHCKAYVSSLFGR